MAVKASGSFRRYLIPDLRPSVDDVAFYDKLRDHRFQSIDDQPVAEPAVGWVAADSFGSSDFRPETVFFGQTLRLRMRIDRKRLPTNAVKVRLHDALGRMGGKVARSARAQLKEEIERELLERIVPATTFFDVSWRPNQETLLFSSTSVTAHDVFCSLFRATFGASPRAGSASALAEHAGAPEVTIDRLRRLAPLSVES